MEQIREEAQEDDTDIQGIGPSINSSGNASMILYRQQTRLLSCQDYDSKHCCNNVTKGRVYTLVRVQTAKT